MFVMFYSATCMMLQGKNAMLYFSSFDHVECVHSLPKYNEYHAWYVPDSRKLFYTNKTKKTYFTKSLGGNS